MGVCVLERITVSTQTPKFGTRKTTVGYPSYRDNGHVQYRVPTLVGESLWISFKNFSIISQFRHACFFQLRPRSAIIILPVCLDHLPNLLSLMLDTLWYCSTIRDRLDCCRGRGTVTLPIRPPTNYLVVGDVKSYLDPSQILGVPP